MSDEERKHWDSAQVTEEDDKDDQPDVEGHLLDNDDKTQLDNEDKSLLDNDDRSMLDNT